MRRVWKDQKALGMVWAMVAAWVALGSQQIQKQSPQEQDLKMKGS